MATAMAAAAVAAATNKCSSLATISLLALSFSYINIDIEKKNINAKQSLIIDRCSRFIIEVIARCNGPAL